MLKIISQEDTLDKESIIQFLEVCKQLNTRQIALFLQQNSLFLKNLLNESKILEVCSELPLPDGQIEAVKVLVKYTLKNIYPILLPIYFRTHGDGEIVDADSGTITIDDFRADPTLKMDAHGSDRLKAYVKYFLLSCQIDSAFALTGLPEQRQFVLDQAIALATSSDNQALGCHCAIDHISLVDEKLKRLTQLDQELENSATTGDLPKMHLLLDQGGSVLRAITGCVKRNDLNSIKLITQRYAYSLDIIFPTFELLAKAKLDQEFCDYLDFAQKALKSSDSLDEDAKQLLCFATQNGLIKASLRLLRDQAARLSLPIDSDILDNSNNTFGEIRDTFYESILSNLPAKPIHHQKLAEEAIQRATTNNHSDLVAVISTWQFEAEKYYTQLETLMSLITIDELMKILVNYGINIRLVLQIAVNNGSIEQMDQILFALKREPELKRLNGEDVEAMSFCCYLAARKNNTAMVTLLLRQKGHSAKDTAEDSLAAGNLALFQAYYNPNDFPDVYKLETTAYFFGRLGLAGYQTFIGLLPNREEKDKDFLIEQAFLGALYAKNYDFCSQLLASTNYKFKLLFDKRATEDNLYRIVTHLSPVDCVNRAIDYLVAKEYVVNPQQFRKRVVDIRFMRGKQHDYAEAFAVTHRGIRCWLLQGRTSGFPAFQSRDIYLLICSYLLGKNATEFQHNFFTGTRLRLLHTFLKVFLTSTYGENNWEFKMAEEVGYYQQKLGTEEQPSKKSRPESALQPLNMRVHALNITLFFRPIHASTQLQEKPPVELKHKNEF